MSFCYVHKHKMNCKGTSHYSNMMDKDIVWREAGFGLDSQSSRHVSPPPTNLPISEDGLVSDSCKVFEQLAERDIWSTNYYCYRYHKSEEAVTTITIQ